MCGNVSLIGRAGEDHGLPVERKCEYRSVSHSSSSPEEGQVCQHKGAVTDVDCKERGMICQGVERGGTDWGGGWECREKRGNGRKEEWQKDSGSGRCSSGRVGGKAGLGSGTTCQQRSGVNQSPSPIVHLGLVGTRI